ncbi:MAG: efflux RND transporter permease subunit [Sulfurospirillum sp.]|nr:efflux RND transporter permease subunit [Sulfurospirillum sp.]
MGSVIKFFIDNSKMNYVLFLIVCLVGIYSYNKTPKEIFPTFELDRISISGGYSGASIDILDKMAVREIEDELQSVEGINEIISTISPGVFRISIELIEGINKYDTSAKIKDSIDMVKQNFPEDMNDPRVTVVSINKSLLSISITSSEKNLSQLIDFAKDIKTKILAVDDVAEIKIYGDSDMYYNILIDEKKIESFGLNKNSVFNAISGMSYIFPIGKIEGSGKHYFLSTYNGKKDSQSMQDTILRIDGKQIYLRDIAIVEKRYEDASTLSSLNTNSSISLAVYQTETGNALNAKENISKFVEKLQKENRDINFVLHNDNSQKIEDRLNVVVSNILFGLILIFILLVLLINTRMAIIVGIGIPTSFIMAATYFYIFGYTINVISLIGVLVALGIVVDDAIVVSENIQQKVEDGMEPRDAAIKGSQEMFKPVFMASLTTMFTFIPLLSISGTMGEFIKLIPIAVSALIFASLIESFIFLPIHAAHTLKKESKTLSWERANKIYSTLIHKIIEYKKTFLFLFIIIIPILTVVGIKKSKFQMFPRHDSRTIDLSIKADINTPIEKSYEIVDSISKDLYELKDEMDIKTISAVAGYRRNTEGSGENYPYVSNIKIELYEMVEKTIVDKYITPYLSFYYDDSDRIREKSSTQISKELREFIKKKNYKKEYNLDEIFILEKKAGPVKTDIKIGIISNNNEHTISAIDKIETALKEIDGIKSMENSAKIGIDEIKFKINSYGESLGINERTLGQTLSNLFLSKKKTTAFDDKNLLEIKIESINKDNKKSLDNMRIPLGDGRSVALKEVVDYEIMKSFERVSKDFGEKTFYIYANVDTEIITATEVIDEIEGTLEQIKDTGVKIKLLGEKEKKDDFKKDMVSASTLSMLLVSLSMLYLFNSFRDTFILMSIIPFSFLGVLMGHFIMGANLTMPSIIGALGLAGVVINDGIIMMTYLKKVTTIEELYVQAAKRLRPILLTTITTLMGLSTLIFWPTGEAVLFRPLAISLGFGLAWGTVLNLLYIPSFFAVLHRKRFENKLN